MRDDSGTSSILEELNVSSLSCFFSQWSHWRVGSCCHWSSSLHWLVGYLLYHRGYCYWIGVFHASLPIFNIKTKMLLSPCIPSSPFSWRNSSTPTVPAQVCKMFIVRPRSGKERGGETTRFHETSPHIGERVSRMARSTSTSSSATSLLYAVFQPVLLVYLSS